jgi:hypothetical protein
MRELSSILSRLSGKREGSKIRYQGVKLNPARVVPLASWRARAQEFVRVELSRSNIHPTIVVPFLDSPLNIYLLQS